MARTRHLPIWRTAFDLAAHLERSVARFSRAHKYALGSELRQTSRRLCRLVTRANAARAEQRAKVLDELVLAVEDMKTLLMLAQEVHAFASFHEFAGATELTVSLGRQSRGAGNRIFRAQVAADQGWAEATVTEQAGWRRARTEASSQVERPG